MNTSIHGGKIHLLISLILKLQRAFQISFNRYDTTDLMNYVIIIQLHRLAETMGIL